jgi:hypothetical protein
MKVYARFLHTRSMKSERILSESGRSGNLTDYHLPCLWYLSVSIPSGFRGYVARQCVAVLGGMHILCV